MSYKVFDLSLNFNFYVCSVEIIDKALLRKLAEVNFNYLYGLASSAFIKENQNSVSFYFTHFNTEFFAFCNQEIGTNIYTGSLQRRNDDFVFIILI